VKTKEGKSMHESAASIWAVGTFSHRFHPESAKNKRKKSTREYRKERRNKVDQKGKGWESKKLGDGVAKTDEATIKVVLVTT